MLITNNFKAQTLTGNPTVNYRSQLLASRALNMSCSFSQSVRSIESRCVVIYTKQPPAKLFTSITLINPSVFGSRNIPDELCNSLATDALAHSDTMTSAAMILNIHDTFVLVIFDVLNLPPVPSLFWEIIENSNVDLCFFPNILSTARTKMNRITAIYNECERACPNKLLYEGHTRPI